LAKEGYNPQYGARPLKRLIQNKILTPVASMIISKGIMKGGALMSASKMDNQFTFDVKKGRKGSLMREEFIVPDELRNNTKPINKKQKLCFCNKQNLATLGVFAGFVRWRSGSHLTVNQKISYIFFHA
jgi:hypothetical protein